MNGKVLALGIVSMALGLAAFLGNKVGAMASSGGGGCESSCSGPAVVVNAPTIPSIIVYALIAVGVIVIITAFAIRGPKKLAT